MPITSTSDLNTSMPMVYSVSYLVTFDGRHLALLKDNLVNCSKMILGEWLLTQFNVAALFQVRS